MPIFRANRTTITTIPDTGHPHSLRVEHPAMDDPITVSLSKPGQLSHSDLKTYSDGQVRSRDALYGRRLSDVPAPDAEIAEHLLGGDLIEALAVVPGISDRVAEALPDVWETAAGEGRSHLIVGPIWYG